MLVYKNITGITSTINFLLAFSILLLRSLYSPSGPLKKRWIGNLSFCFHHFIFDYIFMNQNLTQILKTKIFFYHIKKVVQNWPPLPKNILHRVWGNNMVLLTSREMAKPPQNPLYQTVLFYGRVYTKQKMKFFIWDFFSKYDQIQFPM